VSTRANRIRHSGAPRCETCGRESATSFSWFADRATWYEPRSGTWKFTGACTSNDESYYVLFYTHGRGFLDCQAAQDNWIRHLSGKRWFDLADFRAMLARFEAVGGSLTPTIETRAKNGYAQRYRINVKPSPAKERGLPRLEPVALPNAQPPRTP
jgi:hypothetical protein